MISTMTAGLADGDPVAIYAGSGPGKTHYTLDVRELRDLLQPPPSPVGTAPFWIVVALDKAGPCERGEKPYHRHTAKQTAQAEARRLAREHGGRFAVLQTASIVGWTETEFSDDDFIPF